MDFFEFIIARLRLSTFHPCNIDQVATACRKNYDEISMILGKDRKNSIFRQFIYIYLISF